MKQESEERGRLGGKARLLIVNDDGVDAPGLISLLINVVSRFEVRVVAPSDNQSGCSHSITIGPIVAERHYYSDERISDVISYRVYGTPVDCSRAAILFLFKGFQFDLLLSGINRGNNAGLNQIYSGTVSAAREAALFGLPSVALSFDDIPPLHLHIDPFLPAAKTAATLVDFLVRDGLSLPCEVILNVNFPKSFPPKGALITKPSTTRYLPSFEQDESRKELYNNAVTLKPMFTVRSTPLQGSLEFDSFALSQGYITLTPIPASPESHAHLPEISQITCIQAFQKELLKEFNRSPQSNENIDASPQSLL